MRRRLALLIPPPSFSGLPAPSSLRMEMPSADG